MTLADLWAGLVLGRKAVAANGLRFHYVPGKGLLNLDTDEGTIVAFGEDNVEGHIKWITPEDDLEKRLAALEKKLTAKKKPTTVTRKPRPRKKAKA